MPGKYIKFEEAVNLTQLSNQLNNSVNFLKTVLKKIIKEEIASGEEDACDENT